MEAWRDEPSEDQRENPLSILRVKPGQPVRGIITSDRHVGADTHYWHGRSTICTQENCEACAAGMRARWYGYMGIWSSKSKRQTILEFTPPVASEIKAYIAEHGTLRGAAIEIQRTNRKVNSRLEATLAESNFTGDALPAALPVRKILCRMWSCFDDGTLKLAGTTAPEEQGHRPMPEANENRESA